jgi:hypothetical protein
MITTLRQAIQAPENIFYQAIQQSQWSWVAGATTVLDSALTFGPRFSLHLSNNLYPARLFLNIVNTGWLTWDIVQLAKIFESKNITLSVPPVVYGAMGVASLVFGIALKVNPAFVKSCGARLLNGAYQIQSDLLSEEDKKVITLEAVHPKSQAYAQVVYLARIVVNFTLACLSPEKRLWAGLNILGLTSSFFNLKQLQWVSLTRKFSFPSPENLQEGYTYRKEWLFKYTFIPRSWCSHAVLSIKTLISESQRFADNIGWSAREKGAKHFVHIKVPQENLPSCSSCHAYPANHFLEAKHIDWDSSKGDTTTTVEIGPDTAALPPQPFLTLSLFARLGAVFSLFQWGLAVMHNRHAELAGKILFGQKLLALFDLGAVAYSYHQLYAIFYQKYVVGSAQRDVPKDMLRQVEAQIAQEQQEVSRLKGEIRASFARGEIGSAIGSWVAFSQEAHDVIQAVRICDGIVGAEGGGVRATTQDGQALLERFAQCLSNGEMFLSRTGVPLSTEVKSLLVGAGKKLHDGGHTDDAITQRIQQAMEAGQIVKVDPTTQLLSLSPQGAGMIDKVRQAMENGIIAIEDGLFVSKLESTLGHQLLIELQDACNRYEVVFIRQGIAIPITPAAKGLLIQSLAAQQRLKEAQDKKPVAEKAIEQAQAGLRFKYDDALVMKMCFGMVAAVGASFLVASLTNRVLRPSIDLTEMLKKVAPPADFAQMTIGWTIPWLEYYSQALIAHKLFLTIALAIFSPHRASFALSALFQGLTLWKVAQLPWVKVERVYGGQLIRPLKVVFEMLLPTFNPVKKGCATLASHVEENLKAVYDFTTRFLQGSSWESWVSVQRSYGVEISRKYFYKVAVKLQTLASCGCKVGPLFNKAYSPDDVQFSPLA